MSAPNQEDRKKCWSARDKYWKCLEDTNENKEKCKAARDPYEKNCSKQWVKYFDRRWDYLKFKNSLEKGDLDRPTEKS